MVKVGTGKLLVISLLWLVILACGSGASTDKLPVLGIRDISASGDTVYHKIPDFAFVDQDSNIVTAGTFKDKIYVTDFFFTSCPSICPKMKAQMIRLHDEFLDNDEVLLLSHSIDPVHDTVAVLKAYADALGVKTEKWHLVTGDKGEIYKIAEKYLVSVAEDDQAPGGFIHGGHFILVDKKKHIRGYYDGTVKEEVDKLMKDIQKLMNEG